MNSRMRQLVCLVLSGCTLLFGSLSQSVSALDTPNVLMTIDGMTLNHNGLFRNANPADGFNTYQFGPILFAAGTLGRYKSFYFVKNATGDGGISHNARHHADTPVHWDGAAFQIPDRSSAPLDLTSAYAPVIDRGGHGGQIFDPAEYQIEVKFKPNIGVAGLPSNTAPLFTVGLDQFDGFVWDAEVSAYKRANDALTYNIGSPLDENGQPVNPDLVLNTWYESAPKDADGFATWTMPVATPDFVGRGFYFKYGDGTFRTNDVVTGNGKVFNTETSVWDDVNDGLDPMSFGNGATDPARPGSQLKVPEGVPLMSFGAPTGEAGLSLQLKYITLKRINPGSMVARIDENSGFTFRFGSGFTRGTTTAPINVPGDAYGLGYIPDATDQISRFDENGMTNMIFNMRTPDNTGETHRFVLRGGPSAETFDGTTAMVNVRAKLMPGNTAPNLVLVAKDLDGNDNAANPVGGEEYRYTLPLSMFNETTFTTVSIPLNDFLLQAHVPYVSGDGGTFGSGFANAGDGSKSVFDLYEFAGLIPPDTGLLKLELDYMEIRLPDDGVPGDFNDDGNVDGRDFLVWQRGQSPSPLSTTDLADWRSNYGTSGLTAAVAVPEPVSALLLVICGAAVVGRRRR